MKEREKKSTKPRTTHPKCFAEGRFCLLCTVCVESLTKMQRLESKQRLEREGQLKIAITYRSIIEFTQYTGGNINCKHKILD
jgi:hypothetical protein